MPTPPRTTKLLRAAHIVGHAEARPDDERRKGVARLRRSPDRPENRPLEAVPEPGTSVPTAAVVFGPRNWPVSGFIAWRLVPVQG